MKLMQQFSIGFPAILGSLTSHKIQPKIPLQPTLIAIGNQWARPIRFHYFLSDLAIHLNRFGHHFGNCQRGAIEGWCDKNRDNKFAKSHTVESRFQYRQFGRSFVALFPSPIQKNKPVQLERLSIAWSRILG